MKLNDNNKGNIPLIIALILSIAFLLFATSCNSPYKDTCYECNKDNQKEIQEFITKNLKSANNMSDEEMEDVIIELRKTAIKTICKQKQMLIDNQNGEIILTKNDTLNYFRFYDE